MKIAFKTIAHPKYNNPLISTYEQKYKVHLHYEEYLPE